MSDKSMHPQETSDGGKAILDGMLHLGSEVESLKVTMNDFRNDVAEFRKSVREFDEIVKKLYRLVAGETDLHINGLLQKDVDTQARIDRVEERLVEKIGALEKKHYKLKSTIRDWTVGGLVIAAVASILWAIFGDIVKEKILGKPHVIIQTQR